MLLVGGDLSSGFAGDGISDGFIENWNPPERGRVEANGGCITAAPGEVVLGADFSDFSLTGLGVGKLMEAEGTPGP